MPHANPDEKGAHMAAAREGYASATSAAPGVNAAFEERENAATTTAQSENVGVFALPL